MTAPVQPTGSEAIAGLELQRGMIPRTPPDETVRAHIQQAPGAGTPGSLRAT